MKKCPILMILRNFQNPPKFQPYKQKTAGMMEASKKLKLTQKQEMIAGSLKMSPRNSSNQSVQCQVRFRLLRLVGLSWVWFALNLFSLYFTISLLRFCGRVVWSAAQIALSPWVRSPHLTFLFYMFFDFTKYKVEFLFFKI